MGHTQSMNRGGGRDVISDYTHLLANIEETGEDLLFFWLPFLPLGTNRWFRPSGT